MSGILLDTHVLLWLLTDNARLGPTSRTRLEQSDRVHVSSASTWELAIKAALGKVTIPDDLEGELATAGLVELPITVAHTLAVRDVTGIPHDDPFDRVLVAQAQVEDLTFLTADRAILGSGLPHIRSATD